METQPDRTSSVLSEASEFFLRTNDTVFLHHVDAGAHVEKQL